MGNSNDQNYKNFKNDANNYIVVPSYQKLKQSKPPFSEIEKSILKNPLSNLTDGINTTNILSDIAKKQSDMILNSINQPYNNLQNYLSKSLIPPLNTFSNTLQNIVNNQLKLIDIKLIGAITNPLMNVVNQIAEAQKAMMNTILSSITIKNPFFDSLSKSLEEAKANPKSIYSWFEYYDRLSEFFWIIPYKMKSEELYEILANVTTEQEFDQYISRYFNKEKVNLLINDIKDLITRKQDIKLFEQIVLAYNSKSYSLSSMGLMSIIDNLLSYYLINKGCTSRIKLFEPIIKDIDRKREISDNFPFIVMMINSNINLLYEDIEFNDKIKIKTNKKARRNPVSHGKSYSNKKIDTIMLFNTVYYLLVAKEELKEYKDSLCYDKNKKEFYFPDKSKKREIKNKIKENVAKHKKLNK